MVILNQCNGGISILMITMMTTKVRCTQVEYIYSTLVM